MPVLPLPGDSRLELRNLPLLQRNPSGSLLPETDVDPGFRLQLRGYLRVAFPACDSQLEERIIHPRFDLRREHSGRCPPGFPGNSAPIADQDLLSHSREFPAAGCPYRASPDDDNIISRCHLGVTNLSETFDVGVAVRPTLEENSMIRNTLGFAALAVVAMVVLKFVFGLFGFVLGILGSLLWLAFLGFLIYMALRVLSPRTADRVKETISGRPAI